MGGGGGYVNQFPQYNQQFDRINHSARYLKFLNEFSECGNWFDLTIENIDYSASARNRIAPVRSQRALAVRLTFTGQERFGNMTRVYYKDALGAFIVFDVTRPATFDAVIKWKQDLDAKVSLEDGTPIPCVLLANKVNTPAHTKQMLHQCFVFNS